MINAIGYCLKENIQIALSYITRTADEKLLDVLDDICRFAVYSFQANNERNGLKRIYYYFLFLTACSNMALRYVWQILHVLTCPYNELSTFFHASILISSSASRYIVK